jgi:4-hydroxy-tetrahydrodipicolinate reductase
MQRPTLSSGRRGWYLAIRNKGQAAMGERKIAIAGVGGRMGRTLVRLVSETPGVALVAGIESAGSTVLGADIGVLAGIDRTGVMATADALEAVRHADAVIDFTVPSASVALAALSAQARIVHVVGTTGFSADDDAAIRAAARHARIVKSGNMSLGVNLLARLVEKVAAALGPEFDIEILEMHHRRKIDAPSGTALLLGDAAARGRDIDLAERAVRVRDGHTGARRAGDIGFATLRGGSVVGEHAVIFAGEGERIELVHKAESREIFARGAIRAAVWGFDKPPGLYSMQDVLGL